MKYLLTILLFILQIFGYGQNYNKVYKHFTDSNFVVGDKILAPTIGFTLDSGEVVKKEYYDSIKAIADFLNRHLNISIEIGRHTDSRGSAEYNLRLSEYFANSLKIVLVEQFGVNPERISTRGYGESEIIFSDKQIEKVVDKNEKEELHRKNRRIELKIIKN